MASAIEHYREAESLLSLVEASPNGSGSAQLVVRAGVHATLALAGATALQAYSDGREDELEEWRDTSGHGQ